MPKMLITNDDVDLRMISRVPLRSAVPEVGEAPDAPGGTSCPAIEAEERVGRDD